MSKNKALVGISIAAVAGLFLFSFKTPKNDLEKLFSEYANFEGIIVEDVDKRPSTQLITVQPDGYKHSVLITLGSSGMYFYGDRVWVQGKLGAPKPFNGFNYPSFLWTKGIGAVSQRPQVIVLKQHQGSVVKEKILRFKALFASGVRKNLSKPYSEIVLGATIGEKEGIEKNITENFQNTGTSHILAVSGYNISLISIYLGGLIVFAFGRKYNLLLSSMLIIFYVLLTGASASAVRAGVMGFILLLAQSSGRQYAPLTALLFTAAIMVALNPYIIRFDPGFQLSFAATSGISLLVPSWQLGIGLRKIKQAALVSFAAGISTLPMVLYLFGSSSLLSIPINILLVGFIPPIMLFGGLSALPFVGIIPGFIAKVFVWISLEIIYFFSNLNYFQFQISLSVWQMLLLYMFLIGTYLFWRSSRGKILLA